MSDHPLAGRRIKLGMQATTKKAFALIKKITYCADKVVFRGISPDGRRIQETVKLPAQHAPGKG